MLRLIYAYRFSGHLRAKIDPLNRPRHHATPSFEISEFGLNDDDLDKRAEFVHPSELSAADCRVVEKVLEVYVAERHEDERFLDTYRRIGLKPFKERVYAQQ